MIGLCYGIGTHAEAARFAADQMQYMTGVSCTVIETNPLAEEVHPSWLKCIAIDLFPEEDSFLVFDADILCLKPWDPEKIFEDLGRPFCAVPDTRDQIVYEECNNLGIPFPDLYINGGLTIFGQEHAEVWRSTWKRRPRCGKWMEQGALNLALLDTGVETCRLPRWFNVLANGKDGLREIKDPTVKHRMINLHFCGTKIAEVLALQKQYVAIHSYQADPLGSA